ncbi:UNVERIFIED_CONTAM: hypothetical protein RMT77_007499 [Armadillidium vulgare]
MNSNEISSSDNTNIGSKEKINESELIKEILAIDDSSVLYETEIDGLLNDLNCPVQNEQSEETDTSIILGSKIQIQLEVESYEKKYNSAESCRKRRVDEATLTLPDSCESVSKKRKKYEISSPLPDPHEEKRRKDAIKSKENRDKKSTERKIMEKELEALKTEVDKLRIDKKIWEAERKHYEEQIALLKELLLNQSNKRS